MLAGALQNGDVANVLVNAGANLQTTTNACASTDPFFSRARTPAEVAAYMLSRAGVPPQVFGTLARIPGHILRALQYPLAEPTGTGAAPPKMEQRNEPATTSEVKPTHEFRPRTTPWTTPLALEFGQDDQRKPTHFRTPSRAGFHDVDVAQARNLLANTMRDPQKASQRTAELRAHPERRLDVDTLALKRIVEYDEFLCHPDCSIGRHEAIRGSDIDGGLVVTRTPVSPNRQAAFVQELRRQGFSAYTELEGREGSVRKVEQISFRTHDELRASYENAGLLTGEVKIYAAGKEVGS